MQPIDSENTDYQLRLFNTAVNPELMDLQGRQDRIAFTGVTMRNFALPASFNRLQMFCDNYLNFPDDTGKGSGFYFKAAAPYVTFSVINYGRMSTETENLGWIAQHEVLFSVPVEWYRVEKGQLIFHDWGYVCPFIFVDNDQSLGVGREVYGWTKVRGWLRHSTSSWTTDPREPRRLLGLDTELFPNLYAGDQQEVRTLVEVFQDAPMSLFRSPFSVDDTNNPWWSASANLRRSASAVSEAFQFASGMPIFGYAGTRHLANGNRMMNRLFRNAMNGLPWLKGGFERYETARASSDENPASPYMNNLTLKQFRDAEEPEYVCYQALVNSKITIENLRDGGLLGGSTLMNGDITGGYRIHVHEYAEQPIVETLGLEVSERIHDEWGKPVAVLAPILPNWMACDLRYDSGNTLSWRSINSEWNPDTEGKAEFKPKDHRKNLFNTTRGAAIQDTAGPFHYPDMTFRIFPLVAKRERLVEFAADIIGSLIPEDGGTKAFRRQIEDYEAKYESEFAAYLDAHSEIDDESLKELPTPGTSLAIEEGERETFLVESSEPVPGAEGARQFLPESIGSNYFTPNGSSIYMVVTTYGEEYGKMYNEDNNLGRTARREVGFFMPVNWYSKDEKSGKIVRRLVMLSPFTFCTSMRHVLSDSEVNGLPAIHGMIESNDDWWLRESGPHSTTKVLAKLRTLLMPSLNTGQPAEMRDIMEVINGKVESPRTNQGDDEISNDDVHRAEAEAATLYKLFANKGSYIDFMYLKQYRATQNIKQFCYQGMVLVRKRVNHVWKKSQRRIKDPIHVCLHAYPSMPIVRQLGIKVHRTDTTGKTIKQQIKPIRPFAVRAAQTEDLGVNLYRRVRSGKWRRATEYLDK